MDLVQAVDQLIHHQIAVMKGPIILEAQEIGTDHPAALITQSLEIVTNWLGNLIPFLKINVVFRYWSNVDQYRINKVLAKVLVENPNVVSVGKVVGLPLLRHDVTDVDNLRLTLADGLTNLVNHQVRQNAGKQASWT